LYFAIDRPYDLPVASWPPDADRAPGIPIVHVVQSVLNDQQFRERTPQRMTPFHLAAKLVV
jgi:hypothetical protein